MAETSHIEWTDATWNPVTGCTLVSEGCRNCFAAELAAGRLSGHASRAGLAVRNADGVAKFSGEVRFNEGWLLQPLGWKRARRIFVCAHGDLFHESVPDEWIDKVFAVMALAPHHTFQVLTKRPARMRAYLANRDARDRIEVAAFDQLVTNFGGHDAAETWMRAAGVSLPLPNVWLGTSVEDQAAADARVPDLLATPAAVRFLSAEPLLGPMDVGGGDPDPRLGGVIAGPGLSLGPWWAAGDPPGVPARPGIDWVICGGESGRMARPMHPDWARSLRDQCAAADVPFFFKQWGAWREFDHGSEDRAVDEDSLEADEALAAAVHPGWVTRDGRFFRSPDDFPDDETPCRLMERVGKTAAGRVLDGATHDGVPS